MTEPAAARHDETALADDLLGSGDEAAGAAPLAGPGPSEDEDYLAPAARRSRLTTGLLVALIFLLGILAGTALTKTLSPAPAPQVVYVLNDAAPSATPAPTR